MRWTTTKLIAVGGLAVFAVFLDAPGMLIQSVFGFPLIGGVWTSISAAVSLTITLLIINRFGAGTIFGLILGFLELPFPIGGTPGFIGKIPLYLLSGIIADILYLFLRRNKKLGVLVIGGENNLYFLFSVMLVGKLLNIPGVDKTINLYLSMPILYTLAALLLGAIGGYLGYFIYTKIKDTSVVKRIQA